MYYQIIYVLIDKILAEIKENCNYVSMSKFTESRFESDHFEIMFIPLFTISKTSSQLFPENKEGVSPER